MSATTPLAVPGGTVRIGDGNDAREMLLIRVMSVAHENLLRRELADLARNAFGPGGYFSRMKSSLDFLKSQGMVAEWTEAVKQATEMQARGVEPDFTQIEAARQTPAGVVAELFWRTRATHPEIDRKQLAAVITEVNASDLYQQIVGVVNPDHKS